MKKLLLLAMLLIMNVAQSNEYYQKYGKCTFEGTVEDLFNGKRPLPHKFDLQYILAFNAANDQFLKSKVMIVPEVSATTPVSVAEIMSVANSINFNVDADGEIVTELNLSIEDVKTILLYMGSYRVAFHGHTLPEISGVYSIDEDHKVQTHLDVDTDSGLSFHLLWNCELNEQPAFPGQNPGQRKRL
jgi:hypothetical protein